MNIEPLISLPAFVLGFLLISLVARVIVEVYLYRQKKSLQSGATLSRRQARTSQQAIQRYYNRY